MQSAAVRTLPLTGPDSPIDIVAELVASQCITPQAQEALQQILHMRTSVLPTQDFIDAESNATSSVIRRVFGSTDAIAVKYIQDTVINAMIAAVDLAITGREVSELWKHVLRYIDSNASGNLDVMTSMRNDGVGFFPAGRVALGNQFTTSTSVEYSVPLLSASLKVASTLVTLVLVPSGELDALAHCALDALLSSASAMRAILKLQGIARWFDDMAKGKTIIVQEVADVVLASTLSSLQSTSQAFVQIVVVLKSIDEWLSQSSPHTEVTIDRFHDTYDQRAFAAFVTTPLTPPIASEFIHAVWQHSAENDMLFNADNPTAYRITVMGWMFIVCKLLGIDEHAIPAAVRVLPVKGVRGPECGRSETCEWSMSWIDTIEFKRDELRSIPAYVSVAITRFSDAAQRTQIELDAFERLLIYVTNLHALMQSHLTVGGVPAQKTTTQTLAGFLLKKLFCTMQTHGEIARYLHVRLSVTDRLAGSEWRVAHMLASAHRSYCIDMPSAASGMQLVAAICSGRHAEFSVSSAIGILPPAFHVSTVNAVSRQKQAEMKCKLQGAVKAPLKAFKENNVNGLLWSDVVDTTALFQTQPLSPGEHSLSRGFVFQSPMYVGDLVNPFKRTYTYDLQSTSPMTPPSAVARARNPERALLEREIENTAGATILQSLCKQALRVAWVAVNRSIVRCGGEFSQMDISTHWRACVRRVVELVIEAIPLGHQLMPHARMLKFFVDGFCNIEMDMYRYCKDTFAATKQLARTKRKRESHDAYDCGLLINIQVEPADATGYAEVLGTVDMDQDWLGAIEIGILPSLDGAEDW